MCIRDRHKQLDYLSSYYKFKQPTLLYDQQIQRRDDLEKKLTQRLTLNIEKNRNNITVLRQHFNIRRLNDLIVQYQKMSRNNENRLINLTYNLINHNKANLKNKIEQLNQLKHENHLTFDIEVDGGINDQTSKRCVEQGATMLVTGSYFFKQEDYAKVTSLLKE